MKSVFSLATIDCVSRRRMSYSTAFSTEEDTLESVPLSRCIFSRQLGSVHFWYSCSESSSIISRWTICSRISFFPSPTRDDQAQLKVAETGFFTRYSNLNHFP